MTTYASAGTGHICSSSCVPICAEVRKMVLLEYGIQPDSVGVIPDLVIKLQTLINKIDDFDNRLRDVETLVSSLY